VRSEMQGAGGNNLGHGGEAEMTRLLLSMTPTRRKKMRRKRWIADDDAGDGNQRTDEDAAQPQDSWLRQT